jgi:hypothetical protein
MLPNHFGTASNLCAVEILAPPSSRFCLKEAHLEQKTACWNSFTAS